MSPKIVAPVPPVRWTASPQKTLAVLWREGGGRPFSAQAAVPRNSDMRMLIAHMHVRGLTPAGDEAFGWWHANGAGVVINARNPIWRRLTDEEAELLGKPDPQAPATTVSDLVETNALKDEE